MAVELTHDGDYFLCVIYKEYKARKEEGKQEKDARDFARFEQWEHLFSEMPPETMQAAQTECCKTFHMKSYLRNSFILSDEAIRYMEQRFPRGGSQILDHVSKLALPFLSLLKP